MFDPQDVPLPPELASPDGDADAWVSQLAAHAVMISEDAGTDPDFVGRDLAGGIMPGEAPEAARRWTVTGDGEAEWAMRHVAAATAELESLREQAEAWESRIHAWFMHRAKPLQATVAFMSAHLERYATDLRKADEKRKTVTLPSGKVTTTRTQPKVVVRDEPAVIEWAETFAPAAVARDPRLRLTELRAVVKATQVLTMAWLTNSCGCKVSVRDDEGLDLPDVGTEVECSTCGAAALLGMIEPMAWRHLAVASGGAFVPGVDVDPGGITPKVVLG
jgi:phage host-nuclease inhibitor protein Gam